MRDSNFSVSHVTDDDVIHANKTGTVDYRLITVVVGYCRLYIWSRQVVDLVSLGFRLVTVMPLAIRSFEVSYSMFHSEYVGRSLPSADNYIFTFIGKKYPFISTVIYGYGIPPVRYLIDLSYLQTSVRSSA